MSDPNAGEWEKSKDARTSVVGKQPGVNIANMMMVMIPDLLFSESFVIGSVFQLGWVRIWRRLPIMVDAVFRVFRRKLKLKRLICCQTGR